VAGHFVRFYFPSELIDLQGKPVNEGLDSILGRGFENVTFGLLSPFCIARSWARPADEAELGLVHDGTFVVSPQSKGPAWGAIYENLASGIRGIGDCGGTLGI
jgi:hypothetical protein